MWKRVAIILGVLILIALLAIALMFWGVVKHPLAVYEKSGKRALKSAGFTVADYETPAGTLRAWSAGSGPPLVFLHGAGDTAAAWSRIAPRLTETRTVYVLDLPGHGDSEPAEGPLKLSVIHAGVSTLLDTVAADQPAALVGNSLGGWLALLCALDKPEAVERVFSVNGGGLRHDIGDLKMTPTTREEARQLMEALRDPGSQAIPDFVLDDLIERSTDGPLARMVLEMEDMESHLLDGRLGEIATPVDLVWGVSDRLMPVSYAEKLADALPASRLTRIEACGHIPANECPEQLAGKLRRLLGEAPPAPAPAPQPEGAESDNTEP